jgi:hypothetical protein
VTTLEPTLGLTTFSSNSTFAVDVVDLLVPKALSIGLSPRTHCVDYPEILLIGCSVDSGIVAREYRCRLKTV